MAEKEAALPAGQRIDFVSIVTPNNSHASIATTFLEHGFHVVCDKPMTCSLEEARERFRTGGRWAGCGRSWWSTCRTS